MTKFGFLKKSSLLHLNQPAASNPQDAFLTACGKYKHIVFLLSSSSPFSTLSFLATLLGSIYLARQARHLDLDTTFSSVLKKFLRPFLLSYASSPIAAFLLA